MIWSTTSIPRITNTEPDISLPFLWRDDVGVIYIRANPGALGTRIDTIVGGTASITKIGMRFNDGASSDQKAWRQRLVADEIVALRNRVD